MAVNADIPLNGLSLDIVKKYGLALNDIFSSKFGCVATFNGVDIERGAHFTQKRGPDVVPEKRFAAPLQSGVMVSVWKGDLTCFPAEAVVNAANTNLQHYGGLALALSNAGGPHIQKQSDDYVANHGNLNPGEAIVLAPGLLKYKKIIHAVGPHLSYNPSSSDVKNAEPLLQKVISEILNRVKECHLTTVAIPAISSGLFNYPLQKCADTIVLMIKHYYECASPQDYRPQEICLVNNDEPTVKEIERACRQILSLQQPMSYSQATAVSTRSATRASPSSVEIRNVHLTLKKGPIEEQQVDVIVNTASTCGDLAMGAISKAILTKAGYEMQKEVKKAHLMGHVKVTQPYRLKCKEVYHTFCLPKWDPKGSEILWRSVGDCLYKAANRQYKSIAFPAIGTGNLGFEKHEVASIMLSAVVDFAMNCLVKMDVDFVIYPTDHDTFQAFDQEIKSYMQGQSHPSSPPAAVKDTEENHSNRAPEPRINLSGPSEESIAEARKWYHDLFSFRHPVNICNNFILHFGEEEHYQLSRLLKRNVSIEEFFTQGHACIEVRGPSKDEGIAAVLEVEDMLCKTQQAFVSEQIREIGQLCDKTPSCERLAVSQKSKEFTKRVFDFKKPLRVVKVDKVENPALNELFRLKKSQLNCSDSERMFQRIPAQFCEMISTIGFHAECAPPEDPKYGEGIYFAKTVERAMELWKQTNEEFLYFVEAEVLTGKCVPGKPEFILPPPLSSDPLQIYDSVGGPDVAVIFSGYQALPRYIITCVKV